MKVNPESSLESVQLDPKTQVKMTARRLIAERGVRNVSVREIAIETGQKNLGVVAYYFGTKDKLIAEILVDGAKRIESRRQDFLEILGADGGIMSVNDAVAAIVRPSVEFADADPVYGKYFNRFLFRVSLGMGGFVDDTLKGRWNTGYQKCLTSLRTLLPHLTRAEQNRRFVFLGAYLSQLLAERETHPEDASKDRPTWRSDDALSDIIVTGAALVSAHTKA
ncbi:TetR/AcrR family transcriptional regulator [Hyphomonas sp.]|uniref:TetR/AcrR family transcriptional regulator n=1 Tax=Hyphomonas sp. TaxID=87 RepID=UPI003F7015AE